MERLKAVVIGGSQQRIAAKYIDLNIFFNLACIVIYIYQRDAIDRPTCYSHQASRM